MAKRNTHCNCWHCCPGGKREALTAKWDIKLAEANQHEFDDWWDEDFIWSHDIMEYEFYKSRQGYEVITSVLPNHHFPPFHVFLNKCIEDGTDWNALLNNHNAKTLLLLWLYRGNHG